MSINHFSGKTPSNSNHQTLFSTTDSAAAFWAGPTAAFRFNLNNEDDQAAGPNNARDHLVNSQVFEQEKLFEKPLTPSDVGKLNRLVIPKQHAEKYFPLGGGGEAGEKGLLLGFEDEVGKPWRFRYSYWNSSQSYVLTKGWSRFVKEKRLDAGDIVRFGRHRFDFGRLFIGWRRRNSGAGICPCPPQRLGSPPSLSSADKQTISSRNGNSKRLIRLFGVNLEWSEDESEPSTSESSAAAHRQPYNQY